MARRALFFLLLVTACAGAPAAGPDTVVGCFYYPWYNNPRFNGKEAPGSTTLGYHLRPKVEPALGWYNQRKDPGILKQHFEWARYAGIDFFACSYWGRDTQTDVTIRTRMLDNPDRGNVRICLFWEPSLAGLEGFSVKKIREETLYQCEHYFGRPAYLRVDGKPVLIIYVTRSLPLDKLKQLVSTIRTAAKERDREVYIIGDEIAGSPKPGEKTPRLKLLDGACTYDAYGNMGRPKFVTSAILDRWQARNAAWKQLGDKLGIQVIPGITPGYNDRAVRLEVDRQACSRKLNDESHGFGSMFSGMIKRLAPGTRMVMITSWNEWHEDTQIEPTTVTESTNTDDRNGAYTQGLQYHGYGMLYLDILRRHFGSAAAGPLADIRSNIKYCTREAKAVELGAPLASVIRSLERHAKKPDEKGQEAAKFAAALRKWVGNRNRELLKESAKAPARTQAQLTKHIRLVAGLPGVDEVKAREQEVRRYKGLSRLLSYYTQYDRIQAYIADNGKSDATDQALAQLKERLEDFAASAGQDEAVVDEAREFVRKL